MVEDDCYLLAPWPGKFQGVLPGLCMTPGTDLTQDKGKHTEMAEIRWTEISEGKAETPQKLNLFIRCN